MPAAMFSGFFGALIFKLSELIEKRKTFTPAQIALFVAKAFFTQVAASVFWAVMFFPACKCRALCKKDQPNRALLFRLRRVLNEIKTQKKARGVWRLYLVLNA